MYIGVTSHGHEQTARPWRVVDLLYSSHVLSRSLRAKTEMMSQEIEPTLNVKYRLDGLSIHRSSHGKSAARPQGAGYPHTKGRLRCFRWKRFDNVWHACQKRKPLSSSRPATRLVVTVSYIATLPHLQTRVILAVNHATQFVICLSCPPSLLNVYHIFSIRFFDLKAFSLHSGLRTCCRFTKYQKCLYDPAHDGVAQMWWIAPTS